MTVTDLPAAAGAEHSPLRRIFGWLVFGYPLFYSLGYLSKSVAGAAAIWPAHALTFTAYLLLPLRRWPLIALCAISWDMLSRPLMYWVTVQSRASLAMTCCFALANVMTSAGPAALARAMRLFGSDDRCQLVISPLWIIALFLGSLPGALLGAAAGASAAGVAPAAGHVGLWVMASVLSIVTLGPTVAGLMLGFSQPTPPPARPWEGWAVLMLVLALFIFFAAVPWPAVDPLLQPMLLAVPLAWLALRFSRRATNIGVAIVAAGVVLYAGYGVGIYRGLANVDAWPHVIIAIDVFLVIACGGALLVNLLTLKQRALLAELARDHRALREYARALGAAEETARRKTAADLHDGIGQVLAGQSMTLAAMRAHARHSPLAVLLDEAAEASREAQEGLRAMIQDLSPPGLDHASLDETLRWLTDFFRMRFEFSVAWRINGAADLPPERLRLIYRCVRELLMNARKHSQRRCAEVEVDVSPSAVAITVADQGVGFDARRAAPPSGRRFGLAQLRERVQAAGGTLEIDAAIGAGCCVTVRLPSPVPGSAAASEQAHAPG